MSRVVLFSKDSGYNSVKGVKRLRGGIGKLGPEVKKYNAFGTDAVSQAVLSSHDFVNTIYGGNSSVSPNYYPLVLNWPTIGSGEFQRVGSRINLRAIRFKGWITLSSTQATQVRWRMVLFRLEVPVGADLQIDQVTYLSQYSNADIVVPSTSFDSDTYASFARHNFYKKFKNVDNKDFKAKVFASGVLPATSNCKRMTFNLTGNMGSNQMNLTTASSSTNVIVKKQENNFGYIPLDVSVKINDNVDCDKGLRRYFVCFECDCGYGYSDWMAPLQSRPSMLVNCYARAYFTEE